jgi:hypothetical protein
LQPSDPTQIGYNPSSTSAAENGPRQPRDVPAPLPPDDTRNTAQLLAHNRPNSHLQPPNPAQTDYDPSSTSATENYLRQLRGAHALLPLDDTRNTAQLPAHKPPDPQLQPSDAVQTCYDPSVTAVTENDEDVLHWLDGKISASELDEAEYEKYLDFSTI